MTTYDAIIVGGGPAGSTAALYAARLGVNVLLVDRATFPRDKICGDLIPTGAMRIVDDLGLRHDLNERPHTTPTRLWLCSESERVLMDQRAFWVMPRKDFDAVLFQAAKCATETLEGATASELLFAQSVCVGVRLTMADGSARDVHAEVVVGADGYASRVARELGLPRPEKPDLAIGTRAYYGDFPLSPDEAEIHFLDACAPGYVWVFPAGPNLVNVGVGFFLKWEQRLTMPLPALHAQLVAAPPLGERFAGATRLGSIRSWSLPLASARAPLHFPGAALIGDAGRLIDPLWGHGIDSAMISARLLLETIASAPPGQRGRSEVLGRYSEAVWAQLGGLFEGSLALRAHLAALRELLGTIPLSSFRTG